MYKAKDYSRLLGTEGFSDDQLTVHFGLYEGYVNNVNIVAGRLDELQKAKEFGPEYAELKRRFGWEFGGMRLHELYFGNMTKEKSEFNTEGTLAAKIKESFGSLENAHNDLAATGKLRGIGWAVMAYDADGDRIFNAWVNEHDLGHLAGSTPLLVMDVFEHAFVFDYGMKRAEYIDAFFSAIDWQMVEDRFAVATT